VKLTLINLQREKGKVDGHMHLPAGYIPLDIGTETENHGERGGLTCCL